MTTDDRYDNDDIIPAAANDDAPQRHTIGASDQTTERGRIVTAIVDRDDNGVGRLMLSMARDHISQLGSDDPRFTHNVAASGGRASNDNVIWAGDDGGHGGIYARDASALTLTNGDVAVAWTGADQIVQARVYSALNEGHFETPAGQSLTLKATLADLGMASAFSHSLQLRLKLSALPDSGFVASWTTELALATILFSKVFLPVQPAEAGDALLDTTAFVSHDLPPLAVPRGRSAFNIRTTEAHKLEVTFPGQIPGQDDVVQTVPLPSASDASADAQQPPETAQWERSGSDTILISSHSEEAAGAEHAHQVRASHSSEPDEAGGERAADDRPNAQTDTGASTGAAANDDDGRSAIHLTPGSDPALDAAIARAKEKLANAGTYSEVTIGPTDSSGHASILVDGHQIADNALIYDAHHPDLDLSPSATNAGDRVGVSYVAESTDADGGSIKSLLTAVISETGHVTGGAPTTIATSDSAHTTFSGIDIAAAPGPRSDAGPTVTVAVAWVVNAQGNGYGTVSTQLLRVENGTDDQAPGSVTVIDSNGDAAGTGVDLNGATAGDVIGRSPDAQGLSDGSLAVAWVERSNVSDKEEIHAVVISPDSNDVPQALNLGDSMPNGVMAGTSPEISTAPDGRLIISWLQAASSGGSEAAAKVFKHVADLWLPNGPVIILAHFDNIPQAFTVSSASISSSGGDDSGGLSLSIAWHDASGNIHGTSVDVAEIATPGNAATSDGTSSGNSGHGSSPANDTNSGNGSHGADTAGGATVVTRLLPLKIDASVADTGAANTLTLPNTPADNSGSGSHHDIASAVTVRVAASVDLPSDTINFASDAGAAPLNSTAFSTASTAQPGGSGPSQSDLNSAIEASAPALSDPQAASRSGHGSGPGSDQGPEQGSSGSPTSGSSAALAAAHANNDNIRFGAGFGNDAPDFAQGGHGGDIGHDDSIASLFDDLQLANALNQLANDEVLTFGANNVVTITNFNDYYGRGGGSFFDTA